MADADMKKEYDELFNDLDKSKAFDEIAELFYFKNFGNSSKSEIELLMFKIFMEVMIEKSKIPGTNVIDYAKCSDYKIGMKLGLIQQRVRNLKVKKEIIYPQKDFDWKESLALLLKDEKRMHFENGMIRVNIPDPNLYYAIQDYVENQGGYIEMHLNPKILEIKQEYMVQLAVSLENDENQEKILSYVNKQIKKERNQKTLF